MEGVLATKAVPIFVEGLVEHIHGLTKGDRALSQAMLLAAWIVLCLTLVAPSHPVP